MPAGPRRSGGEEWSGRNNVACLLQRQFHAANGFDPCDETCGMAGGAQVSVTVLPMKLDLGQAACDRSSTDPARRSVPAVLAVEGRSDTGWQVPSPYLPLTDRDQRRVAHLGALSLYFASPTRAGCCISGIVRRSKTILDPLRTCRSNLAPGFEDVSARLISPALETGLPSNDTMTSPG